ncbi:CUB and peptidase domain-containing protein 1-like [Anopheles ziemanni]|uniref:CUB and peptidase domain-containing protein 1-like n=1 Tax=Anopheles coustani TaxID=139045 RepID=UPI002659AF43|nr:CUB and peptidase domain-containing protein 1-like [Anopheles coustani]XP_058178239.1 CUB and peptidase domain-containing protein 1-like [Anopheles ziemanni]
MGKVISNWRGFFCVFVGLLLPAGPAHSVPIEGCGVRKLDAIGLIVKGQDARPGDWPWHVAIYDGKNTKTPTYACGGSIISEYFVLTAAHCFQEPNPVRYSFKTGVHLLNSDIDTINYALFEIIIHPKFDRKLYNDIALLRPENKIVFKSTNVWPICLWSEEANVINVLQVSGISVGFGFNENHEVSNLLQQAAMNLTARQRCIEMMPDHLDYLAQDEGKICAVGKESGSSVCSGDSGGGLYYANDKVWYLRGIVSAGARKDLGNGQTSCDTSLPATYTDVAKYRPWIDAHEKILDERNLLKDDSCGEVRNDNITDEGKKPIFNQYPWNALLEFREAGKPQTHLVCSGVLIHPRYVLTVGHCLDGILRGFSLASVRLGEFNLRTTNDTDPAVPGEATTTQSVDVETYYRHPKINQPMYSNDWALVKLKHDASLSKHNIRTICLPSLDDFKETSLTLTGWKRNKFVFPKLERDTMNLSSPVQCRDEYKKLGINLPATDDMVCAFHKDQPKANCNNYATGSPLQYIKVVDKKPRYFLAGLMVLNFPFCRMNGSEVFVSLTGASEWIKKTVIG